MGPQKEEHKLPIIGRERALVDRLANDLQRMVGGPPASMAAIERLRRHNSSKVVDRRRGASFEVQIVVDGEPTGHIARVEITLDRFEPPA